MENAKIRSRQYFNEHRNSKLAHGGYWRHDYKFALEKIGEIAPHRLIDIGCGPGAFLSLVNETFPDISLSALDLSEEMIDVVRERLGGDVNAVVGDSENMPLDTGLFDMITCNMSIHHYPHPQAAVNEMARILKPGGYLILNDMDCIPPIRWAANIIFPMLPGGDVKMYERDEIVDLLYSGGFRNIRYRKISPFSFQCIARKQ